MTIDTALRIWNRVISWTGIFTNIISDRELKLTSELCRNLHQLSGIKLTFSTAYHRQTDSLDEIIIQTLADMVRKLCAYGLELKDCDGFTHYVSPDILEKGWNPRLLENSLRKELVEIHPIADIFERMLDKDRMLEVRCIEDSIAYAKEKWDKSNSTPDFKVEDSVIVSTTNFNNIKEFKNLKGSFEQPFISGPSMEKILSN
ncbi:hypothetical protein O181_071232 [Austropuccinia psidii MF-1]|uniref:Integrase catalytic domain-containing protein n=1 Tax=Austropuccinia psidii MF-1 TaxID=1389203 RepID=A0A9Q3F4S8_9BASI|nr:hypothetical protein [Austropuccinia psidii MF-1]